MSSDWWWLIGATLTTIVFVVPPTIYAWYVLEVWIGAGEASYAKVMREIDRLEPTNLGKATAELVGEMPP